MSEQNPDGGCQVADPDGLRALAAAVIWQAFRDYHDPAQRDDVLCFLRSRWGYCLMGILDLDERLAEALRHHGDLEGTRVGRLSRAGWVPRRREVA